MSITSYQQKLRSKKLQFAIRIHNNSIHNIDDSQQRFTTIRFYNSDEEFVKASALWLLKWERDEPDFATYFDAEYLKKHSGWHEGKAMGAPSTNNCLESTNNVIKKEWTMRNRLGIREFLEVAFKRLRDWSIERSPDCVNLKMFAIKPTYTLNIQKLAYQWVRSKLQALTRTAPGFERYYLQTYGGPKVKDADITLYERQRHTLSWRTFDTYAASQTKLYFVEFQGEVLEKATCTCSQYLKEYVCPHILGIAIRLKIFDVCPEAKTVPIGQKRKRGRPTLARKALLTQ